MDTKYPIVKVSITKSLKFRAKIQEEDEPPYEVTIGGREWSLGKGRQYEWRIRHRILVMLGRLKAEGAWASLFRK